MTTGQYPSTEAEGRYKRIRKYVSLCRELPEGEAKKLAWRVLNRMIETTEALDAERAAHQAAKAELEAAAWVIDVLERDRDPNFSQEDGEELFAAKEAYDAARAGQREEENDAN